VHADGHAAFVNQSKYLESFFRGTDESHAPIVPREFVVVISLSG